MGIEVRPPCCTILQIEIDLTLVPPDAADYDRDMPSWDVGPKLPTCREIERMIKEGY